MVQRLVVARSSDGQSKDKPVAYNKQFGYSRKDVLLIGGGLIGLGFGLYYGLQAFGMDAGIAGNWVQLIIFMGICVGWVSTYLFRVATKVRGFCMGRALCMNCTMHGQVHVTRTLCSYHA